MAEAKDKGGNVVVIKKYANRRLYNTATSAYVTLDDLAAMVREGVEFVVYDAKTNDELTRQVLTQIIFEEETRGQSLLPVQFLRQLIGFYGGHMQGVLPSYLEMSLDSFARQQEQFRSQFSRTFGATPGGGLLDETVKQNMVMFERAMKMFSPFAYGRPDAAAGDEPGKDEAPPAAAPNPAAAFADAQAAALEQMRLQMEAMQAQIARLAGGGAPGSDKP